MVDVHVEAREGGTPLVPGHTWLWAGRASEGRSRASSWGEEATWPGEARGGQRHSRLCRWVGLVPEAVPERLGVKSQVGGWQGLDSDLGGTGHAPGEPQHPASGSPSSPCGNLAHSQAAPWTSSLVVCLLNSPSSAEHQWVESSPKSTLALLGGSRPAGSLLGASEFSGPGKDGPGRPPFPPAELQTSFHGHELSLVEPPEALGPPSSQAFLSFSTAPSGGGLAPREDSGALLANSHGASPAPGPPRTAAEATDNGFLSHNFLTVAPGHSGHHSPVLQGPGMTLPGQPPLPEKKRASEGDRSFGSVSPSSSGFSSPHSGSTMSIPFPNVLPDFSKAAEAAAPSPGRCVSAAGGSPPAPGREGPGLLARLPCEHQRQCWAEHLERRIRSFQGVLSISEHLCSSSPEQSTDPEPLLNSPWAPVYSLQQKTQTSEWWFSPFTWDQCCLKVTLNKLKECIRGVPIVAQRK